MGQTELPCRRTPNNLSACITLQEGQHKSSPFKDRLCRRTVLPEYSGREQRDFTVGVSGHSSLLGDHPQGQVTVASVDAWHGRSKWYFATVVFSFRVLMPVYRWEAQCTTNGHQGTVCKTLTSRTSNRKWSPQTRTIKRTARRHLN